jgi:hypothetical protein
MLAVAHMNRKWMFPILHFVVIVPVALRLTVISLLKY